MEGTEIVSRGLLALPNEILLSIFSLFLTPSLVQFAPTCQHIHSIVLRLLHQRLQIAAGLAGHTLYLDCHHPSVRLTEAKLFCCSIGTDGLDELLSSLDIGSSCVGRIRKPGELYSRFRPQLREPPLQPQKHPAGDIPGSRTWRAPSSAADYVNSLEPLPGDQVVSKTVTVDAHDLFSQLTTLVYLGKRETSRGLLFSIREVSEGTIRVWREWLSRRCESKKWTDGEKIAVHHDTPNAPIMSSGKSRSASVTGYEDPTKDPSILWINTRDDNVGIKFRVKERNMRRSTPILFADDTEVAVSYKVEFDEVLVRTTHLLLKLEEAQQQMDNHNGKAIVFGSYARLQEFDTAGHPRR